MASASLAALVPTLDRAPAQPTAGPQLTSGAAEAGPGTPPDVRAMLAERLRVPGLERVLDLANGPATLTAPRTLADLTSLVLGPDLPPLPLPQPSDDPLPDAFAAYAAALDVPLPAPEALRAGIAGLGLDPDQQAALAQLILSYNQAVALHREALAGLSDDELRLAQLEPEAASAWMAADPGRTWEDLEAEAMRILQQKGAPGKTLQAADLLARAVEAARGPLARLPSAAAPAAPVHLSLQDVAGALSLPSVELPEAASLREALLALYAAYGFPAPEIPELGFPPSFDHAVARMVAVKAAGVASGAGHAEAAAFLQAAQDAKPTLQAWAEVLRLRGEAPAMQQRATPPEEPARARGPLGLLAPSGPSRAVAALRSFEAARDVALQPLAPGERAAALRGPEVQSLFRQAAWTEAESDLVAAWARAHRTMDPEARDAYRSAAAALESRSGGACTDALRREPGGCASLQQAAAASAPLPTLPSRPQGAADSGEPALFDDSLLRAPTVAGVTPPSSQSYLCEERDNACVGPASLLRIGGTGSSTYSHVSVIHIDLGGNDTYVSEVAGSAFVGLRDPPPLPWPFSAVCIPPENTTCAPIPPVCIPTSTPICYPSSTVCIPTPTPLCYPSCTDPDPNVVFNGYCIPPQYCRTTKTPPASTTSTPSPVCIPTAFGRGSYSLDLEGDDRYDTPDLNGTQGSIGVGPNTAASTVLDSTLTRIGTTAPYWRRAIDSQAMAWASVLLDLSGNDTYLAKARSQGSALQGVGLLIDAAGADTYAAGPMSQGAATFVTQSPQFTRLAVGGFFDLAGDDLYRFDNQATLVDANGAGTAGMAVFLDAGGADTYESTFVVIPEFLFRQQNPSTGPAYQMQGWFSTTTPASTGIASFTDAGAELDAYFARDKEDQPVDISVLKNDVSRVPNGNGNGAGLFVDSRTVKPEDYRDTDDDGAPGVVETLWGTDPNDPASHPGNAFRILSDPDPNDLHGTVGLDREGPWLTTPSLPQLQIAMNAGSLALPGLAIGGRGDDQYGAWIPLIIDLGGDDLYTGERLGGVAPFAQGTTAARHRQSSTPPTPPTDVVLLLDLGGGAGRGNDGYTSTCNVDDRQPAAWGQSNGRLTQATAYYAPAACPSFGGAINGIAILADDGGSNTFRSEQRIRLDAVSTPSTHLRAIIEGYAASQGAGLFNGVGILATWNATNTFEARVNVTAIESDVSQVAPVANAYAVAQGAGYSGTGILAAFGPGSDSYALHATARAVQQDGRDLGIAQGLGQGATVNGIGILFDEAGQNRFLAPQGYAQGFGQGRPGLGLLWAGSGDDTLEGGQLSQGAAFGAGGTTPQPAGFGVLLNPGGDDIYRIVGAPGTCAGLVAENACTVAQGAAMQQGTGLLLDVGGNDSYEAAHHTLVQGAGLMGVGVLLDQGGHDAYRASARAQGYAFYNPLFNPNAPGTYVARFAAAAGVLLDEGGWDFYQAAWKGQGYGEATPAPLACVQQNPTRPVAAGPTIPGVTQTCLPGPCASGLPLRQCNREAPCLSVAAPTGTVEECPGETLPAEAACAEPCPHAVLGLLLDAGGTDHYAYTGAKCSATGEAACIPDGDGNDWQWRQGGNAAVTGLGVDAPAPEDAYSQASAQLEAMGVPAAVQVRVDISHDAEGSHPVGEEEPIGGTVHLIATVSLEPPLRPEDVRRVDFLVDSQFLGPGDPFGDGLQFRLPWHTRTPQDTAARPGFEDGVYAVVASVHLEPEAEARRPARPTLPTVESPARHAHVDNPPLVQAALSAPVLASDRGDTAQLTLTLTRDLNSPPGCNQGHQVLVTAQRAGEAATPILDVCQPPGVSPLSLDGRLASLCSSACPDGHYTITVEATDTAGTSASAAVGLLLDGTPPTSHPLLPAFSGVDRLDGGAIRVHWEHADQATGGGGEGVGVATVRVVRVLPDSTTESLGVFGPETTSIDVTGGVAHGARLRILTIATDALGHVQAVPGEAESQLDFEVPALTDLKASRTHVRPNEPIEFTVHAAGAEAGLSVRLGFDTGFPDGLMSLQNGLYRYSAAAAASSVPAETPFVYTAVATDAALNQDTISASGVLDSRPPRVDPQVTLYGSANTEATSPGSAITLRVRVHDAGIAAVMVDPSPFLGNPVPAADWPDCSPDPFDAKAWRCNAIVPLGTPDGAYALPWVVRDLAGNLNTTAVARVLVSNAFPVLQGVEVAEAWHDGFAIRWSTDINSTSRLLHGSTSSLDAGALGSNAYTREHRVEVRGLAPATLYFVKAISVSQAGRASESATLLFETGHGYTLALPGLTAGAALRGTVPLAVHATLLDGGSTPVGVEVKVQDARERGSAQSVGTLVLGNGTATLPLDTRTFPDGSYRILLRGLRAGDALHVASPAIRVDNTAPFLSPLSPRFGEHVARQPMLNLSVADLAGGATPLASLQVRVDGMVIGHEATWADSNFTRLSIRPATVLRDGERQVHVSMADTAGNVGHARWNFTVDTLAPVPTEVRVEHLTGTTAARPGGRLRIVANVTDGAGVAGGEAHLDTLGPSVPFLHMGGTLWVAEATLAADAPAGVATIPLWFRDGLGTAESTAEVEVRVDATPPALRTAVAQPDGFTALRIDVEASEPVLVRAGSGAAATANATAARIHHLRLEGLAPGTAHNLTLTLTDEAGHWVNASLEGTTPADGEAPGSVRLEAASHLEGVVELRWTAAADNAGIAAYRVERRSQGAWERLATVPGLSYTDGNATAGALAEYRVAAIDVAGQAGPPSQAVVRVLALPRLLEPDVLPRSGPSDQPFRFQAWYRNPAGGPPDRAEALYGEVRIPLAADPGQDCRVACLLHGKALLPATALAGHAHAVVFVAASGDEEVRVPLGWAPRVMAAGTGLEPDARPAPAASVAALLILFALAARAAPAPRSPRQRT